MGFVVAVPPGGAAAYTARMAPQASRRLVPEVPDGPGRRQQYSASTKAALVEVAEGLFAEQGYAATSLDQVVAGARVTKGALYHHFSGKQALFTAVFAGVEGTAGRAVRVALDRESDPWVKAHAGLRAFLEVVQSPGYRRIVIQDGPSVLDPERFREQEQRSTFATVAEIVRGVLTTDDRDLDPEMLLTFTRIFFGALSSAGESVATSDDPATAAARVESAIAYILAGLQSLGAAGVAPPSLRT
jgi:AcrR family transcriptional regulator